MHQGLKTLFVGTTLLFAAPAFAQGDDASGGGGGSATVGAGADANAGGAGAGAGATVGASVDAGAGGLAMWSDQLIAVPQTLPKSGLGVIGTLEIANETATDPTTGMTLGSATFEILQLGAAYGISDKLTVGALYAVDLHDDGGTFPSDDRWKGPLDIFGAFNIMHKDKLSVTAGADFGINLANTDSKAIHAGLSAKYMVSNKLAVFTGNILPVGPAGQHLSIDLGTNGPITFALPVGVGLQLTPQIFAFADTTLASFSISNSSNAFIFSDFIPLEAGALFRAAKDLDVGVIFNDDLKHAGDAYAIGLTARFYKH
jgi:hypothetical protein